MDFIRTRNILESRIGNHNPDMEAHLEMTPFKLRDRKELLVQNKNPRIGGVMILVFNKNGEAHFTLIRRPKYEGVHSAQIAFPGGKKDDIDINVKGTAIRETHEEVGVLVESAQVLGEISQVYIPPSKFLVTPFVAVMDEKPVFTKDDYEVAEVLEVPLSLLLNDSIVKEGKVPVGNEGMQMKVPYFDIFGHKVWGATAIMLNEFKAIIR